MHRGESIRSASCTSKFNQRLFGVSEVGMGLEVIAGFGRTGTLIANSPWSIKFDKCHHMMEMPPEHIPVWQRSNRQLIGKRYLRATKLP